MNGLLTTIRALVKLAACVAVGGWPAGCVEQTTDSGSSSSLAGVETCATTPSSRNLVFYGPITEGSAPCTDGTVAAQARVDTVVRYCMDQNAIEDYGRLLYVYGQSMAFRVPGGVELEPGNYVRVSCFARYVNLDEPDPDDPEPCRQVNCCQTVHCLSADVELMGR